MASKCCAQEQQDTEPSTINIQRGFDCEFVEPPPTVIQTECPVCLLIIREPHQVTCCGKKFCGSCLQQLKDTNIPCPTCNASGFSDFPDKALKQTLTSFRVRCSHQKDGCEWTGELGQLDAHLNEDPQPGKELQGCVMATISCNFHHVGCTVKLPRKDMSEHLREDLITHMSLLAASHAQLMKENQYLKDKIQQLRFESTPERLPCTSIPLSPSILTLTNFQHRKKQKKGWFSPPVYTHHHGYKICLAVVPDGQGIGKGTHVSVYINFMKGEFDDSLKWPFRGTIWIQLLDQGTGMIHKLVMLSYTESVDSTYCSRVTEGSLCRWGLGVPRLIAHSDLEPKYLQNDTLLFQIPRVELK